MELILNWGEFSSMTPQGFKITNSGRIISSYNFAMYGIVFQKDKSIEIYRDAPIHDYSIIFSPLEPNQIKIYTCTSNIRKLLKNKVL